MAANFASEWHHCKFCGAGFLVDEDLVSHEDECSLKHIATLQARDFQKEWYFCSFCGVGYLSQKELDAHESECIHKENGDGAASEEEGEEEEDGEFILIGEEVDPQSFQTTCYGSPDEREKWLECPLGCGLRFLQDELLLDHMETAHFSLPDWQVIDCCLLVQLDR